MKRYAVRNRYESARLEAISEAKALHRKLDTKRKFAVSKQGFVDVFGAIEDLKIPLVFDELDALGFCLPYPHLGIMINKNRSLHIQRFTAGHELGHAVLEHEGSVDHRLNYRGGMDAPSSDPVQEVAADAFAAEFMLPRWLYKQHIQTQGWSIDKHLRNPEIVYQLSLRMGASYEATCWGLLSHNILAKTFVEELVSTEVAMIKRSTVADNLPGNSWANVWRLSQKDNGAFYPADTQDLLRLDLSEVRDSRTTWDVTALKDVGFEILSDDTQMAFDCVESDRRVVVRPPHKEIGEVLISQREPNASITAQSPILGVVLDLGGKEIGKLSRGLKRKRGLVA
ncbi:MAG: ImmA/IrrE family metallo-endopeptidase [Litorimonas sp.]